MPTPAWTLHDRVRVHFGEPYGWCHGTIIDTRKGLRDDSRRKGRAPATTSTMHLEVRVRFDDRDQHWIDPSSDDWLIERLFEAEGDERATESVEHLKLVCSIDWVRLTDPARGRKCRHVASCNYSALSRYVTRLKKCPHPVCTAPLPAPRDIVRDRWLAEQLPSLADQEEVWVRNGQQVLLQNPKTVSSHVVECLDSPDIPVAASSYGNAPAPPRVSSVGEKRGCSDADSDVCSGWTSSPASASARIDRKRACHKAAGEQTHVREAGSKGNAIELD